MINFIFKGGYEGYNDDAPDYQDILEFSPESERWTRVAMRRRRWGHAISVVNFEDFAKHCDFFRSIDAPRGPSVRPSYLETKQKKRKNWRKNRKNKKDKHNHKKGNIRV